MTDRYRKNPIEIEAVQLRWDTWSDVCDFAPVGLLPTDDGWAHPATDELRSRTCRGVLVHPDNNDEWNDRPGEWPWPDGRIGLLIPTLEGDMLAVENDWIIRGVQGEFYPCKNEIFLLTYERVEQDLPLSEVREGEAP